MITYTVKYKRPNGWFWSKLKKVQGDGIIDGDSHRFFILDDDARVEIPLDHIFKFGKERFLSIKANMEAESGQDIKTLNK